MNILYLVPTPIGNLEDMTFRAVNVLKKVELIAAEDTRVSRTLLQHFQITKPMISYFEHNEVTRLDQIFEALRKGDVAVITDAGSPGISDPGYTLVREAIKRDVQVVALPGPTAFVPALTASGLAGDSFVFLGFLGKKLSQRQEKLRAHEHTRETIILYESPYRIVETLQDVLSVLGDRQLCVARELSKKFETYYRFRVSEAVKFFCENQIPGEIVIIIEGKVVSDVWTEKQVILAIEEETRAGKGLSMVAKEVARLSGWKKKEVYELGLRKTV